YPADARGPSRLGAWSREGRAARRAGTASTRVRSAMMTREIRPAPSRLWTDDRGLSIFLVALVAIIVVPALGPVGLPGRLLSDALISLMLVSGAAAVADRPQAMLIVSVITVAA